MTATTPNYAIPYPEITDFVKDGATAMEAIAEKVDDILSTGAAARNLLYNGAMQVVQRGTPVTSVTGSGYYTADRWLVDMSVMGTWTQSVENDAPTGSGFRKSLKMLCTTANASPIAGAFAYVTQRLEGQDLQAIKKGTSSAQSLTVSFWVKSNLTGTYAVRLLDQDNSNRMTSAKYTINASATWEYKTITFGPDTTGQLDNDNAASLWVSFWLAGGSNFTSGTTQSWGAYTAANEAPQQANLAATVNNYWQITGVQLTIGTVAPPFQFKNWAQELRECQRYYQRMTGAAAYSRFGMGSAEAATIANIIVPLWTTPRSTNVATDWTLTYSAIGTTGNRLYLSDGTAVFNITALGLSSVSSQRQLGLNCTSAGLTTFRSYYFEESSTGDEWLALSTEL